ncbi:outer membrane lipoprotein carrier protein LolA [Cyclobacteriaceae bacterium]|jgi:outer membrane lipoprotein carrier protein|nr:outer membrane lipoprotein carrier protein LolA [Cyclobacteriaceae bacterium]|tara:strand:+ start:1029 stop:1661 length:633 start_codon:yes stop_codon:yes gene_type:complete
MKKLSLGLIVFMVTFNSSAQFDPEAELILESMSKKYKSKSAFMSTFQQNLINEVSTIDESISGTVYVKGDKYKLEIAGQIIFNDGQDLWSYSEEIMEVTVSTYDKEEQEISLTNIWDLYREGYKYGLNVPDPQGNWVIDLEPIERGVEAFYKIRMVISNEYDLKSFRIFEESGNQYNYIITKLIDRSDLTDGFFTFDLAQYPEVELIDFR